MLKSLTLLSTIFISIQASANCDIDPNLLNKVCSSDYFSPKNQKQLNEYLQYGKFKNGKLLNLDINFDIKDKEVNIATNCDVKLSRGTSLKASLNGICIKGASVELRGENKLDSDSKAPIFITTAKSILLRRSVLQTKGEIILESKIFNPFDGEILISRDSVLRADKINVFTPSNLIINKDSSLRSSEIILNGGNCEICENDDGEHDDDRDRGRSCKKFTPKFQYTGKCATNPIPTTVKIASTINANDSLNVSYLLEGRPTNTDVRWRFDNEAINMGNALNKSFLFPGRHLIESIVVDQNGYFRKMGLYQNLSPNKFNKRQIAIFQFSGLKRSPIRVTAMMGLKKVTLLKSDQNPELYSGEIPVDIAGNKLIAIPAFGYKGSFYLNVLPAINNPNAYINSFIDSTGSSLNEAGQEILQGSELISSLTAVLNELKIKINSLPIKDQAAIALKLQANSEGISNQVTKSGELDLKFNLLNLLIPTANAQSVSYADRFIPQIMKEYALSDIKSVGVGITSFSYGLFLFYAPSFSYDKPAGLALMILGSAIIIKEFQKRNKIIIDLYDFIGNIALSNAVAGEVHTIRLAGNFVPVTSSTKGALLQKSRSLTDEFNNSIIPVNESLASINSLMSSIGLSSEIIGSIPTLSFPTTSYQSPLSSEFISDVQLVSSDYGDVSLKSVNKIEDGIALQFNASRSQNATVRIFYKNDDFNVYVYKDVVVKITVAPKAVINYTKNNLVVNFDSTDPANPDATNLHYEWYFGADDPIGTTSKTVSHTYSQPGTYKVDLTVFDDFGNSDTISKYVEVTAPEISFFFHVNPNGTYLRVDSSQDNPWGPDRAVAASKLDLTSLYNDPSIQLRPGDIISMQTVGFASWDPSGNDIFNFGLVGVFAGDSGFLNPGPKTTAPSVYTSTTTPRGFPTDIPQDRGIPAEAPVKFEIPDGATRMLFTVNDGYFRDNSDPNADFGVTIKITIIRANQIPLN